MSPVSSRVAVAVAAPNAESAAAAVRVAEDGGNAVDAALAAMLVAMVNEPGIVSLAGGAYVTLWPASGPDAVTVDGYVEMPGRGGPVPPRDAEVRTVQTAYGGGVTMTVGPGSVATPGALAAADLAHATYGRLPWREVVAPAEDVARGGFRLGAAAGYYLPYVRESVFAWDPQTAAALRRPDGGWVEAGDRMVLPGLADTLAEVAAGGAEVLYRGDLAARLAADMRDRGGMVTAEDLAQYRAVVRPALPVAVGDWAMRTNPPPAIGGAVLAAMLVLLGDRPHGPWTPDDVAHLVATQREVLGFRHREIDVADDRTAAARRLLAEVGAPGRPGPASTAHVSVVDSEGTACAVTASCGYGSGATVPGTGLWLNNCLGEHELNRGPAPSAGARLASNMAPTVGRTPTGRALAAGSPGADRITTALLQVLAAVARGADVQEAVDRPRVHVHAGPEVTVEAEEDLPLPDLGLPVRRHHPRSMYFGGVGVAWREPDGSVRAAGDPRRAAAVASSTAPGRS
jgi:gamma-glutamyltranspeptidase/glutathione hydrolase